MSDLIELLKSRAGRLEQIFGDSEKGYPGVQPYFCLTSPRRPRRRNLNTSGWPNWMKKDDGSYIWMKLHFPKNRKVVTVGMGMPMAGVRCKGRNSASLPMQGANE